MTQNREIVYIIQQHTMMYQNVEIHLNHNILAEMLSEELTDETKIELIQALYVILLKNKLNIAEKHTYGAWNAKIAYLGEVNEVSQQMTDIINKLKGNVTDDELNKQVNFINNQLLNLSACEKENSVSIQVELHKYVTI